jgi:two-component system, cell cycle sensor histidine kinase and response regulator CckA
MDSPWHETILVVEDAEAIRRMVCAMLAQSGYHCLEACDGAEALDVLESDGGSVNLVLTDMVMPNMTGAELAYEVSRTRPEMRIMFMSGFSDDPVVRTLEHTAAIFLAKPFTATSLMEKVREALDHPWTGLHAGASGTVSQ